MNCRNKIKVCHLTSVHPAKDGRIYYKECFSLAKHGYEVHLIVAGAESEKGEWVNIIGVPKSKGRLGRFIKTTDNVFRKALEVNADIYHLHDPELLPIGLKLKKRGKIVIFDSHEFVGEQILTKTYIPKVFRRLIASIYKGIEGYICKRIDAVIEICTIDGKDYFKNRCRKREFITNAPNIDGNDCLYIEPGDRIRKVVHVGGLTYERGVTFLAEAISNSECKLVLAGTFSSISYKEEILNICGDKLDYRGILPFYEIPGLLKECGIGTCTLLDKGQYKHIEILPTKVYDYMVAGLPIIMSNFPFLESFNQKYDIGLCVDPSKPEAISEAINYLISHPEEAIKKGRNGQKAILNEYNWKYEEKKLLKLYESLIYSEKYNEYIID